MIGLLCGVAKRRENVLALQEWIIAKDLFERGPSAQQFQYIGYAHALAADAGSSSALAGIYGDA